MKSLLEGGRGLIGDGVKEAGQRINAAPLV
jgi:hypothetical protein